MLLADRNAVTIFTYRNDGASDSTWIELGTDADGTTLHIGTSAGTTSGAALQLNVWYHLALVKDGSYYTVYLNGAPNIIRTDATSVSAIDTWYIFDGAISGNQFPNNYLNGRIGGYKCWSGVALSPVDIMREMSQLAPVRRSDLFRWSPMIGSAVTEAARDLAFGRSWSNPAGSPTFEADPQVPWLIARPAFESFITQDITARNLLDVVDTADATSYPSSGSWSITWLGGLPLILSVVNTKASNADLPNTPTTTGLTWTQDQTQLFDTSNAKRVTTYIANPGSSGSGTLTVGFSATQTTCAVNVAEISNAANNATIIQGNTTGSAGSTQSTTLNAFGDSRNGTYAVTGIDANDSSLAVESGYDQIAKGGGGAPIFHRLVEFKSGNDTTPSTTTTTSRNYGIIALEIKSAFTVAPESAESIAMRQMTSLP